MSEKSTKFVMTVKNQTQKPQTTHGKVHKTFTLNEGVPLPQIKVESGMDIYDDDDKNDIGHLEANQLDQVFEDRFGDDDSDIISTIRDHLPDSDCLMQHMDIREPLTRLKQLLEARFVVELAGYQFYLQGAQMLESHKTLVDQCVQGEGVVQINLQIQPQLKRINIIDVLKPADDYVEDYSLNMDDDAKSMKMPMKDKVVQWQLDVAFKKAQERLKIPSDPMDWYDFIDVLSGDGEYS